MLQACAEFDLRPLAASARLVPYVETAAPCWSTVHLSQLLSQLSDRGFTVYLDEARRLSNGITAVRAHPGAGALSHDRRRSGRRRAETPGNRRRRCDRRRLSGVTIRPAGQAQALALPARH